MYEWLVVAGFFSVRAVVWGRHILIGASCFTYICCRLYTVVSDRVSSSTDRIRKLCYIRSYSIEVKTIICAAADTGFRGGGGGARMVGVAGGGVGSASGPIRKAGGVLSVYGPIRKAGVGGGGGGVCAVGFWPKTKSGGGGGGAVGFWPDTKGEGGGGGV